MSAKKTVKKILKHATLYSLLVLVLVIFSYLGFLLYYQDKFYPGTKIASFRLDGLTLSQSQNLITSQYMSRSNSQISLKDPDSQNQFEINIKLASTKTDTDTTITKAYNMGRSGDLFTDLQQQLQALFLTTNFPLELRYEHPEILSSQISSISQAITQEPIEATISQSLQITPSQDGKTLDQKQLQESIDKYLVFEGPKPELLPIKKLSPYFSTQRANLAKKVLDNLKQNPVKLTYLDQNWVLNEKSTYPLLDTQKTQGLPPQNLKDEQKVLNEEKLNEYLEEISSRIYKPMQNARFNIDNSSGKLKVVEFQAAQDGIELETEKAKQQIHQALFNPNIKEITLTTRVTKPEITTQSVNNLGIESSLGEGLSYFTGSIPNRIFNVGLASSRINGTLVAPGETFSFVNTIGDISAATGYKQAYVIKSGRTVLDDGGGVCQVSTTLFRAVLNSGLPIISRTAHAYRVGYYEQGGFAPGLDATVFYPSVDFKFKNDTQNYILIQSTVEGTSLKINLYGKPDGRVATLTNPIITNQTPAPPELRQDDPTLPRGTIKQVDFAAPGANVRFSRTVQKDGAQIIQDTFYSNYKPWQAVFLVGTQ